MDRRQWLLFLPQLPSFPSSLRVSVWRRLRAAGAASLQNGVWALPLAPAHETFLNQVLDDVRRQGGSGIVLIAGAPDAETEEGIVERFRIDRDREYAEVCERCSDFLAEIEKETRKQKFTFAELEENEEDLSKLAGWLGKIQARDFFGGSRAEEAGQALSRCREALRAFAQVVYVREDATLAEADALSGPEESTRSAASVPDMSVKPRM